MSAVVVLGANGFLGSHFVDALVGRGYDVTAVDRFSNVQKFLERPSRIVKAGFNDVMFMDQVFTRGSMLVYAGGSMTPKSSIAAEDKGANELELWLSILKAFGQSMGSRAYFCSSGGAVYGESPDDGSRESDTVNPVSIYGEVKRKSEGIFFDCAEEYGFSPTVWRFGNLYGPRQEFKSGQGIVALALQCAQLGQPFEILGDGSMRRDYTYVEDAIVACLGQVDSPGHYSSYNIGSGVSLSVQDVIREVESVLGIRMEVSYAPQPPEFVGRSILDTSRLMSEYPSLRFRSLREGLSKLIASN